MEERLIMPILELSKISKAFGGLAVINEVSIKINAGDFTAIIGPNGAGKTTLFNIITRHIPQDSGTVYFKGEDIKRLTPAGVCRKGMGRSFQLTSIFPSLTAIENIQLGLMSHSRRNRNIFSNCARIFRQEAKEILSFVGLSDQSGRIAETLAHGDKRRLDIAVALATKAELLLLDEPTSGMSPGERVNVMALLEQVAAERGLTVLFIEHDLDIIFSVAKRIFVLHQGFIIAEGPPDQIRQEKEVQRIYLGGA